MSYANIVNSITSGLSSFLSAIANIFGAVANFISQNADVFGAVLGIGIVITAILGLLGKLPFVSNIFSMFGL